MGSLKARVGCVVVLTAAACACSAGDAGDAGDDSAIEPVDLVGETDQGLRLRLDAVASDEVRLRFPAVCSRDGGRGDELALSLHRHPFVVPVEADGGFVVDESYVEDDTDDSEEQVDVRVDGAFAPDGSAGGTLEVSTRWWDGQSQDYVAECETGVVRWAADGPPVEGEELVVPLADPSAPTGAGADLVVRLGSGELVRVLAGTGEVRPLSGVAPTEPGAGMAEPGAGTAEPPPSDGSPPPAGPDDPSPPTTVAGPGATGDAPIWMSNLAVVGDGVWAVDAATGALSRFDVDGAGGGPTAALDVPLDGTLAGPDALWTVSTNPFRSGYALDRRDPVTGTVLASAPVERGRIVVGPSEVWYVDATLAGGRLWRVDAGTATPTSPVPVDIPLHGSTVVASADRVWWLDVVGRGDLTAVDLASGHVGPIELSSVPSAVAADAAGVWTVHPQGPSPAVSRPGVSSAPSTSQRVRGTWR